MRKYAILSKYMDKIDGEGTDGDFDCEVRLVERKYNPFTWLFAARCWKCHNPVTHDVFEISRNKFFDERYFDEIARVCKPCDLVMFYELDCCN